MNEIDAEKRILTLISEEDDEGFDVMVETFAPMLFRYARRMCGSDPDAEDILQDTFLTAKEKIHQFRGDGKLRNWLFSIAGNACRQRHRKAGGSQRELRLEDVMTTHEEMLEVTPSKWEFNPADRLLNEELKARLEGAIAEVPLTNRGVLIMRDVEGLSTRETADALDISEEAVKIRLHRARAFVRNQLKDYFEAK